MTMPNGQEFTTTFPMDFAIADRFGIKAVKDTYNRAFKEWKDDVQYMIEFVTTLNMKCWYWHEQGNIELSEVYSDLYYKAHYACLEHFKGDKARYYYSMVN